MFAQSNKTEREEILIPASRLPDDAMVASELIRLKDLMYLVPEFNLFGENNPETIMVAMQVITHKWSDNDIYALDNERKIDEALEAKRWLEGEGSRPSEGWDSLAGITREATNNAEKLIGTTTTWTSNPAHIAGKLLRKEYEPVQGGTLHYGHWNGYSSKESDYNQRPFIRHGWATKGGNIIDPCRWIYEGSEPYIYIGPNDHYDEAGQDFAATSRGSIPKNDGSTQYTPPPELRDILLAEGCNDKSISINQLLYLANTPPKRHDNILDLYKWIRKEGFAGFIPLDYYNLAAKPKENIKP